LRIGDTVSIPVDLTAVGNGLAAEALLADLESVAGAVSDAVAVQLTRRAEVPGIIGTGVADIDLTVPIRVILTLPTPACTKKPGGAVRITGAVGADPRLADETCRALSV